MITATWHSGVLARGMVVPEIACPLLNFPLRLLNAMRIFH
jgi:hypothetical protein